jgi:hypothetical protein
VQRTASPFSAGLWISGAHARWDQIDLGDVAPVIELTKELIGRTLDDGAAGGKWSTRRGLPIFTNPVPNG